MKVELVNRAFDRVFDRVGWVMEIHSSQTYYLSYWIYYMDF